MKKSVTKILNSEFTLDAVVKHMTFIGFWQPNHSTTEL